MDNQDVINRIEEVLDRLRPFLQREGGDIHLDHFDFDTGILYVTMSGACNGCYMASSDVSDSVAVLVMDEVSEVKDVVLLQPEEDYSIDSLLKRLQEEEAANKELEEYNKQHK